MFFPDYREWYEGATMKIPYIGASACCPLDNLTCCSEPGSVCPPSDIHPKWGPEFFGDAIIVNGRTWPRMSVEPRRYRFRILNACNARTIVLQLANNASFYVIGKDVNYLPSVVPTKALYIAPAERFDVIIDFAGNQPGTSLELQNVGPDEPYEGGNPVTDYAPADPNCTGKVLRFDFVAMKGQDPTTDPNKLTLTSKAPLNYTQSEIDNKRVLNMIEYVSDTVRVMVDPDDGSEYLDCTNPDAYFYGPRDAYLGANGTSYHFQDPPTEKVKKNRTEYWEIINHTDDVHPVHIHQDSFQLIDRQTWNEVNGTVVGPPTPPMPWEIGFQDTVKLYPHTAAHLVVHFTTAGKFLWHCHILDHEDNEMMRPLIIES